MTYLARLSDIEDRLLAMCEGDYVTLALASQILGTWYSRKIDRAEIVQLVNRLTKLKFAKWQYTKAKGSKKYFTSRLPRVQMYLTFKATEAGESYLKEPRNVR